MDPSQVKAYLERDWAHLRELKRRYWSDRKRTLSPRDALLIADGLRQHARGLRSDWPDEQQREADLETHIRVSDGLRRVARPVDSG